MLRKRRKRKGKGKKTLEGTFLSRHSLFRG